MKIEIRNGCVTIDGYVNAVERDSGLLPKSMCQTASGDFVERVKAGAFRKALERAPDVEFRMNHERTLGSVRGGALALEEDAIGLKVHAVTADPQVMDAAQRGELRGWSFGFREPKDEWRQDGDVLRRELRSFDLIEVSLLTITPAYIGTTVEVRAMEDNGDLTPSHEAHRAQIEIEKLRRI